MKVICPDKKTSTTNNIFQIRDGWNMTPKKYTGTPDRLSGK
jgi:hypothetical protein